MSRLRCFFAFLLVVMALVGHLDDAVTAEPGRDREENGITAAVKPICDLRHPIEARVTAMDPIAHGADVRVQFQVTPSVDLRNSQVSLRSNGGANLVGKARVEAGALSAGQERVYEFSLHIPNQGKRFMPVFRIEGDAGQGKLVREVPLNILIDGPADPGQVIQTSDGRSIRQYSAKKVQR